MYIGLHVKYPFLLSDFNGIEFSRQSFRKLFRFQTSWKLLSFIHTNSCTFSYNYVSVF